MQTLEDHSLIIQMEVMHHISLSKVNIQELMKIIQEYPVTSYHHTKNLTIMLLHQQVQLVAVFYIITIHIIYHSQAVSHNINLLSEIKQNLHQKKKKLATKMRKELEN